MVHVTDLDVRKLETYLSPLPHPERVVTRLYLISLRGDVRPSFSRGWWTWKPPGKDAVSVEVLATAGW